MRYYSFLIGILCLLPASLLADVKFESSFSTAKQIAGREGKLVMLGFSAKWCAPCNMMDQYTYPDQQVQSKFNSSYVPVKVDIDDFDGYALKQQYNITKLPSIIFLDSEGNFVAKYEESMTATRLLSILSQHDKDYYKKIVFIQPEISRPPLPNSTTSPEVIRPLPSNPPPAPTPISEPAPTYTPPAPTYTPPPTPSPAPAPAPSPRPLMSSEGLFEFNVTKMNETGYSVQLGVFAQYDNVLMQTDQLQKGFPNQKILVHIDRQAGTKVVYKIMMGHFQNSSDAAQLKEQMRAQGIKDAFVKNLSTLTY